MGEPYLELIHTPLWTMTSMVRKHSFLLAVLAAALVAPAPGQASSPEVPPCPSKVAAFYYVWYGDGANGWRHWLDADPNFPHDPQHVIATGAQYPGGIERDIAAADYPLLGPYHSHDAVTDAPATPLDVSPADPYLTVDQHLAWAANSGIDVLISSWWGIGTYEDQGLAVLLRRIAATQSPIHTSVYLETWALFYGGQLQPSFFEDPRNFEPDSRAAIRQKAVEWLSYILETYGGDPGFMKVEKNGEQVPIIFIYTAALFTAPEWQQIFSDVEVQTHISAFYQADVEGADFQAEGAVFDGLHLYTPVHLTAEGDASLAARVLDGQAAVYNPAAPVTDPITVGGDYATLASEARVLGRQWAATVIPGFDDRKIRNPSFVVSRNHGDERTYDYFWEQALATKPDWVLITSFNEWHEGTEIEPSIEYGNEFLCRTRLWANLIHACPQP